MSQNLPPGPEKGITLAEARALQKDTLGFMLQAARTYGDIVRYRIGFWDVYLLNHPNYLERVMLTNLRNYGRDTFQFQKFSLVTGQGLLTTHGEYWLQRRRLAQPGFHRQRLAGIAAQMTAALERLVARWIPLAAAGEPVDVDGELLRLALDIMGHALLSRNLAAEYAELEQEIIKLMEYVVYRSQNLLALPTLIPTLRNLRFKRRLRALDNLFYTEIAARRPRTAESPGDLLDFLLTERFADGRRLSAEEVRDELMTLLIAGYETVATGMSWTLYLLSQHLDVQNRARAEADGVLDGRSATFDDLPHLTYIERIIHEALRLYPPSWLLTRNAAEADQIGGYDIPAGALVVISPYVTHRHPEFWPDPERFDPQRFTPEDGQARPRFAYIPFGGGPHLCIGNQFALVEARLALATILHHYRFELVRPVEVDPQVTLRPKPGLWMRLSRR